MIKTSFQHKHAFNEIATFTVRIEIKSQLGRRTN
jgi:hypothetical protein